MQENFEIRIREFGKLKPGWNFGRGETFSPELVELAVQLAKRYYKKYGVSVSGMPNEDGAISLVFNKTDSFLDITVKPESRSADIRYCKGIDKNKIEESWGTVEISALDTVFSKFNEIARNI